MTARKTQTIDDFAAPEQYDRRHQFRPKSLAEQDAEWARQEGIQARAEERARRRQQEPAC